MSEKKIFRYQAIYHDIREKIKSGVYRENELLPPEKSIAGQYQVDRSTVRKSLQLLVEQGLVVKCPGKGTVVSAKNDVQKTPPLQSSLRQGMSVGFFLSRRNAITELFYSTLFYMLENELQARGFALVYSVLDEDDSLPDAVSKLGVNGIVFVSNVTNQHIADSIALRVPCVLINALHPDVPSVLSDNERGAYLICRHLIAHGHRDILALSGVRSYTSNQERLAGYRKALAEAGIPVRNRNILDVESWDLDAGTEALLRYFNNTSWRPTAIFGLNDRLAGGAMIAIHQAGLRVPDDISVVGYDNLDNLRLSMTRMTTIEAHIELMAEAAVKELLWQLDGGRCMPVRVTTPVDLVEGETVKALTPVETSSAIPSALPTVL